MSKITNKSLNPQPKLFEIVGLGLMSVSIGFLTLAIGTTLPDFIRYNNLRLEQTNRDKEALEKYAPQIKNNNPLTIEQGIELIYKEHDNNPKDEKISIIEAIDVLDRIKRYEKRYEDRTYVGWNESAENLYKSLLEIDNKQTKIIKN